MLSQVRYTYRLLTRQSHVNASLSSILFAATWSSQLVFNLPGNPWRLFSFWRQTLYVTSYQLRPHVVANSLLNATTQRHIYFKRRLFCVQVISESSSLIVSFFFFWLFGFHCSGLIFCIFVNNIFLFLFLNDFFLLLSLFSK